MTDQVQFSNPPAIFEAAEELFFDIERRIRAVLPSADIKHVGSTAIRGTLTKGDLDVLVRVSREDFQQADEVLARMFARNDGSDKTADFSAFEDKSKSPELGVQLTVKGAEFDFFAEWVDRLFSDKELRDSYDALKAAYQGKPMSDYRVAKNRFIESNLRKNE